MIRFLLLLVCVVSFGFGYGERNGVYASQSNTHPLYEERRNRLLGIYGIYNLSDSDAELHVAGYESQTHKLSEKQFGFGVQGGYLLNENHRILANFEYNLKKNGFSYQTLTLGYAFTPRVPNTTNWRGLLGVNAGLVKAKFDSGSFVIGDSSMGSLDFTGFTYGVKAGAIYEMGNSELEFAVSANRLNLGEEEDNIEVNGSPTNTKLDLGQTSNISFSVGYNFLF